MTLLLAIHAGSYVLLAADQMEGARVDGRMWRIHSAARKIVDTPLGPVTGSGLVSLLNAVKSRLAAETVSHTDRMLSIIHEERQRARKHGEASEDDITHTSWLLAYRSRTAGGIGVRCSGFLPSLEDQRLVIIAPGKALPVFPSDTPSRTVSRVVDRLASEVRMADGATGDASLRHHLALVCWATREVAANSEQVSTTFDFAVTSTEGTWYPRRSLDAMSAPLDEVTYLGRS